MTQECPAVNIFLLGKYHPWEWWGGRAKLTSTLEYLRVAHVPEHFLISSVFIPSYTPCGLSFSHDNSIFCNGIGSRWKGHTDRRCGSAAFQQRSNGCGWSPGAAAGNWRKRLLKSLREVPVACCWQRWPAPGAFCCRQLRRPVPASAGWRGSAGTGCLPLRERCHPPSQPPGQPGGPGLSVPRGRGPADPPCARAAGSARAAGTARDPRLPDGTACPRTFHSPRECEPGWVTVIPCTAT